MRLRSSHGLQVMVGRSVQIVKCKISSQSIDYHLDFHRLTGPKLTVF
jgi:hypothetical protein